MPSQSLRTWDSTRSIALDEIESAHRLIGGSGPGRRYATQQINQAYAILLSSQFQGFCRDLHSECVERLTKGIAPTIIQEALGVEFRLHRKLDRGNPNPGNVGADFGRLGLDFWTRVEADDARNANRASLLEELNRWRNAIAHQDFDPAALGGRTTLHLHEVQIWRRACDGLGRSFDSVMQAHLQAVVGASPW